MAGDAAATDCALVELGELSCSFVASAADEGVAILDLLVSVNAVAMVEAAVYECGLKTWTSCHKNKIGHCWC